MPDRMEKFIREAERMPSLPSNVGRLLSTMKDPTSSSSDIEKLIIPDATLSAKVLRLANSAFYYRMEAVNQVSDALLRLGFKTVRSLIVTVWTHTLKAFRKSDSDEDMITDLLNHGTACAVVTRELLFRTDRSLSEDGFVAALLHDMGRVALACQLGSHYRDDILEWASKTNRRLPDLEDLSLGFNHTQLGAHLMNEWHLSKIYEDAALRHHDEEVDPESEPLLAAVMLADSMATEMGHNIALETPRADRSGLIDHFRVEDTDAFLEKCSMKITILTDIMAV